MILGLREEEQMPRGWKIADDAITTTHDVKKEHPSIFGVVVGGVLLLALTTLAVAGLLGALGLLLLAADWVGALW